MLTIRFRSMVWFATGALLTVAVMVMFANAWRVDAAPGDSDTTFVPLAAPCRLADTRPAPDRIGTNAAFGTQDTKTLQAVGTNGECTIPADAVGLSLNVTSVGATALTFLTLWPGGPRPTASNLNPSPGAAPTPNAVTVTLSSSGAFDVYNHAGNVDVIVDINGYSTKSSLRELTTSVQALNTRIAVLEASRPFTVASERIDDVSVSNAVTAIRQVTVSAPVAGNVALVASGEMEQLSPGEQFGCGLMDSVSPPPAGRRVTWRAAPGNTNTPFAVSRVYTIPAGTTATYFLVCTNYTGPASKIFAPQLTAIFTPAS